MEHRAVAISKPAGKAAWHGKRVVTAWLVRAGPHGGAERQGGALRGAATQIVDVIGRLRVQEVEAEAVGSA